MQLPPLSSILTAKLQGDRSYLLVFAAGTEAYEVFLPGAGYPGEFTGFMTPSLRKQSSGESWQLEWPLAEDLASHLVPLLATAGAASSTAAVVIEALRSGQRYAQRT
jgi:hypothetical protein